MSLRNDKLMVSIISMVIALMVLVVLLWPKIREQSLWKSLEKTSNAEDTDKVIRKILKLNRKTSDDFLDNYANRSPLRSFDKQRKIFILLDGNTGDIYTIYTGIAGSVEAGTSPDIEKAILESMSGGRVSEKMSVGDPPILFSGVRCVESTKEIVSFVFKEKDKDDYIRYSFKFKDSILIAEDSYDVTEEEKAKWRTDGFLPD